MNTEQYKHTKSENSITKVKQYTHIRRPEPKDDEMNKKRDEWNFPFGTEALRYCTKTDYGDNDDALLS